MKILAIDTATELCSAALSVDGELRFREQLDPTGHSKLILDMVESLLVEADIRLDQLDLLATDVGPGSFTGMRIGLGVAQGLAYGADLPIAGVHSLAALAAEVEDDGRVFAAIDARMGEIYCALFDKRNEALGMQGSLSLCRPDAIEAVDTAVVGIGSGWDSYADTLSEQLQVERWLPEKYPHARQLVRLADQMPSDAYVDAATLMPVYLRNNVATVGTRNPLRV